MASEPAPHITLTADFGRRDHYEAAVRAQIRARNSRIEFTNISLEIEQYNIVQGAFVLRSVYRDFPKGSVHIFAINAHGRTDVRYLAS
jgi:S-adenosylmethionine hydrolase